MRSTYAVHLLLIESVPMHAEDRRKRALSAILEARAAERARASIRVRRAVLAIIATFIAGCILLPAPIL